MLSFYLVKARIELPIKLQIEGHSTKYSSFNRFWFWHPLSDTWKEWLSWYHLIILEKYYFERFLYVRLFKSIICLTSVYLKGLYRGKSMSARVRAYF